MDGSTGAAVGRIALVTGSSRGIGEATVRRLARRGWSVVVNYAHDQRLAEAVVDSILAENGAALAVRADVTDELDVERLFSATVEWCGGVDAVVHAVVGTMPTGSVHETSVEQFDALTLLNGRARFLVSREAARHVRDDGVIVHLSSSLVQRTLPGFGAHAASEAATDVLTRVLAGELLARRINVNAVSLDFDGPCEPDRIADVVLHLLSDDARGVTGQIIGLDGGRAGLDASRNGDAPVA